MRADVNGIIRTEPIETCRNGDGSTLPVAATVMDAESSAGWNAWMEGHKALLRGELLEAIAESMVIYVGERDDKIAALERQVRDLELRLAEARGAIDILRTGRVGLNVRGTFDAGTAYNAFDVVMHGGSSWVATRDCPGEVPGPGWQLLASAGKRGERGVRGPQGERGMAAPVLRWISFDSARMALSILMNDGSSTRIPLRAAFSDVKLDRKNYAVVLVTADGTELNFSLRELFEQFDEEGRGR
jgi:hypothetical protein